MDTQQFRKKHKGHITDTHFGFRNFFRAYRCNWQLFAILSQAPMGGPPAAWSGWVLRRFWDTWHQVDWEGGGELITSTCLLVEQGSQGMVPTWFKCGPRCPSRCRFCHPLQVQRHPDKSYLLLPCLSAHVVVWLCSALGVNGTSSVINGPAGYSAELPSPSYTLNAKCH